MVSIKKNNKSIYEIIKAMSGLLKIIHKIYEQKNWKQISRNIYFDWHSQPDWINVCQVQSYYRMKDILKPVISPPNLTKSIHQFKFNKQ